MKRGIWWNEANRKVAQGGMTTTIQTYLLSSFPEETQAFCIASMRLWVRAAFGSPSSTCNSCSFSTNYMTSASITRGINLAGWHYYLLIFNYLGYLSEGRREGMRTQKRMGLIEVARCSPPTWVIILQNIWLACMSGQTMWFSILNNVFCTGRFWSQNLETISQQFQILWRYMWHKLSILENENWLE